MSAPDILSKGRHSTITLGLLAAILVILFIVYPDQAFQSSLQGLKMWWDYVFPALLPFLIVTELLFGLGVIHGIGTLLDPLMRLVFRLPGIGGWPLAAGLFAGYPAGAGMAAKLRREGAVSRDEAEHLLALTHLCSPVTIITIVGAGFLQRPEAGVRLAIVHYAAALLAGLAARLLLRSGKADGAQAGQSGTRRETARRRRGFAAQAVAAMQEARGMDGRAFGKLLGDAVYTATQTLLMIGGFIMVFSVMNRMLSLLLPFLADLPVAKLLLPGLLEPHLGAFAASRQSSSAIFTAACIGAALGWSGLSLHAQVKSMIAGTDIRFRAFLTVRFLHAAFAFLLTFLLWKPLAKLTAGTAPVSADNVPNLPHAGAFPDAGAPIWQTVLHTGLLCIAMLAVFVLASTAIGWLRRLTLLK